MYHRTVSLPLVVLCSIHSLSPSLSFIQLCSVCRQQAEIENSKYIQWYCHYGRCWHAYRMRSEFSSILHAQPPTHSHRLQICVCRCVCVCESKNMHMLAHRQPHKHLTARLANKHSIIAYFCASSSQNGVALFAPSQQELQSSLLFCPVLCFLFSVFTCCFSTLQCESYLIWCGIW